MANRGPLSGIRVLDFSTLLPGPMATLILAEAGATVVKVERPASGDEMRSYEPRIGSNSANFVLLNRGKLSVSVDLKQDVERERIFELAAQADVVIEQFRPGVMDRLGLGYQSIADVNPRVIYCSISGYGRTGQESGKAGHDLNYMAESGTLSLTIDSDGAPALPSVLVADIAGGAYPAVMNILLAVCNRARTGRGSRIDLAMRDNIEILNYWALAQHAADGGWPQPGNGLTVGASPRYQIYRTQDDRYIAAAPLEDRFWSEFCEAIDLPARWRGPSCDQAEAKAAVRRVIAARPAAEWQRRFEGRDVCCTVIPSFADAHEHGSEIRASRKVAAEGHEAVALPVPLSGGLKTSASDASAPLLGEHNGLLASGNWEAMEMAVEGGAQEPGKGAR